MANNASCQKGGNSSKTQQQVTWVTDSDDWCPVDHKCAALLSYLSFSKSACEISLTSTGAFTSTGDAGAKGICGLVSCHLEQFKAKEGKTWR